MKYTLIALLVLALGACSTMEGVAKTSLQRLYGPKKRWRISQKTSN